MSRHRPPAAFWPVRLAILIRPFKRADQLLPCLYVAGDLAHFEMPAMEAMATARDYQTPDEAGHMRAWRRLDAHWLGYLNTRMQVAAARGPVHPTLAARWAAILAWSEQRWSTPRVQAALAIKPDARYAPPALPVAA